jgi:hypothetical protein
VPLEPPSAHPTTPAASPAEQSTANLERNRIERFLSSGEQQAEADVQAIQARWPR